MSPAWRIYYADGSTFDSEDGTWEEAPAEGVQCVVVRDTERGRVIYTGSDYYAAVQGEPYGITEDLGAYLRAYVPAVKFGLCIPAAEFHRIHRTAVEDPDFGRWSPRRRWDD